MRQTVFARLLLPALAPGVYLLLCALAGALLGYPLVMALHGSVPLHVLIGYLAEGCLFIGMWPLSRRLGVRWADFGFPGGGRRFLQQVAIGFGLGAAMLGAHVLVLMALDIRILKPGDVLALDNILGAARRALSIGFPVALLEESLFRGLLLGSLVKSTTRWNAVLVCSLYFASLHFLKTDVRPEFAEVRWYTGFPVAFDAFLHLFGNIQPDTFVALFTAGLLLGVVRLLAPGNIGYCMGLHAGWVFVIKFSRSLTKINPDEPLIFLVGHYDGIIGYLAAGWMLVLVVGLLVSKRLANKWAMAGA